MDFKNPNFRKDIERKDEPGVVIFSNLVFIGGMEIYTGEGKRDCQGIPDSGKQTMGRMPASPWVWSPLPGPCPHTPRLGATPDTSPPHTTVELDSSRNMSSFPFPLPFSLQECFSTSALGLDNLLLWTLSCVL